MTWHIVDYFLKIDGVDGESTDDKHKGEIEVESFSWGETQSGTAGHGGGGGAGKVQPQDFHFVKKLDKASPVLFIRLRDRRALQDGRPDGAQGRRRAAGVPSRSRWQTCLVSSYQLGGSAHGDVVPTDQVSLNFAKLEIATRNRSRTAAWAAKRRGTTSKNVKV